MWIENANDNGCVMGKHKRKKGGSSGSESDERLKSSKQTKIGGPDGLPENCDNGLTLSEETNVSDILKHTNSVLYEEQVFHSDYKTNSGENSNCGQMSTRNPTSGSVNQDSNMAAKGSSSSTCLNLVFSTSEKLDTLINIVTDLKKNQEWMRKMFES